MDTKSFLMDFETLLRSVKGRRVSPWGKPGFASVCIDSRKAKEDALFVALPGSVQDGHSYVEAAFKAGASCALVEEARLTEKALGLAETAEKYGRGLIAVADTLKALQDAAAAYLDRFSGLLKVGITGSSGKTTTKEIAAAIIGQEKKVVMNQGNLNSETGLPLSVFEVRPWHEVGVFELGMNRPGEIAELARVLKPRVALITNIGSAHIGLIGSKAGIAEEKKNIFAEFSGAETALIPGDDEYRDFLGRGIRGKVRFYGLDGVGFSRDLGLSGSEITWAGETVRFTLPGKHNVRNAFAAAAIAREVPVSDLAIREGLASVKALFGRSEILEGRLTVIRDCYNANPESSAQALAFCDDLEYQGRKIYVMGSMLELGEDSPGAHRELGRLLAASRADKVFLYGGEMEDAAAEMEAALAALPETGRGGVPFFHTNSMDQLARELGNFVRKGDLVLLKGSRGCALEGLTDILLGGEPAGGADRGGK
ncbi:MAG: UDP-N-acetylmuramoyl-tripeptide--D-alanyl-D-alanine ligase [Treponema sp.]|jgi:UDP-N-acetylmuramoyl-tripeptide--D-alanyl-D-alanine ligase|nr:UDP-N-acetylmuramoyl-tripeptide--D-alanyl-D-alanine ligase [Treponema sp.]